MTIKEAFNINIGKLDGSMAYVHPKFIIRHINCIGTDAEIQFTCKDIGTAEDELEQLFAGYCLENGFNTSQVIKIICIDMEYSQIKKIAYAKYLLDWILSHKITIYDFNEIAENWNDEKVIDWENTGSFFDYIIQKGFDGQMWNSYKEFLNAEYLDRDVMKRLLSISEYAKYKKEIKGSGD